MSRAAPLRIAHGYGNRRHLLERALRGPVDYIEADVWYGRGHLWLRHERRLGFLPILYDSRRHGREDSLGPFAISIGPHWYIRPDLRPIHLEELLEKARGKRRLLLDLKGRYSRRDELLFAQALARVLAGGSVGGEAHLCGQNWSLLGKVREVAPQLQVRLSIERPSQWRAFCRRLAAGEPADGVCLHRALIDGDVARYLDERAINAFCWTVNDPLEARRLLALGVAGIISDDLSLLASLKALAPEEAKG